MSNRPSSNKIKSEIPSGWEMVIGFETHVQLKTQSKLFSNASIAFGALPNTQVSIVDAALPGTLPVLNRRAVELAMKFAFAVNAKLSQDSVFARKHYFYPDLPKGYQISQYDNPIVQGGYVDIELDGQDKRIELTRAHLEEDAGKSTHDQSDEQGQAMTGIDLNRAGTPLLEIVTEPVMRSAREAVTYARTLHALVVWLDICDGNLQEGSFRCDANVSVRRAGETGFGTRCEIKNLNSFRFLERAIIYEANRQIELIEDGGKVVQQTRLYNPDRDETRAMRSKEDAHDYRYFADPDLKPVIISDAWRDEIKAQMPELPHQMKQRLIDEYQLSAIDASLITQSRAHAQFFEQAVSGKNEATFVKTVVNWMNGELAATINQANREQDLEISQSPVSPAQLARLVERIADGTLSNKMAKDLFALLWDDKTGDLARVDALINEKGMKQENDAGVINAIIDEVIAANPSVVEEVKAGKEKAMNALVGQVMKRGKGAVNPQQAAELLKKKLG
jgi:aspartyl-tRNA(Asn)/glutamyl-tRNA(Gln) amidotransferase subunit B